MRHLVIVTLVVSIAVAVTNADKKGIPCVVKVYTGNIGYAGTDANVFMKVDGQKILLKDSKTNKGLDMFNRAKMDKFEVDLPQSKLDKIIIGHDNAKGAPGWYLVKVVIYRKDEPGLEVTFNCNRWLSRTDDDKKIVRELKASDPNHISPLWPIPCVVETVTGDRAYAGTDANVFIKVAGQKILLKNSKTNRGAAAFEGGKIDKFEVNLLPTKMKTITIGHDNAKGAPGWFLNKVVIFRKNRPSERVSFSCGRWLSRTDEDKKIVRVLKASSVKQMPLWPVKYVVKVYTGGIPYAGTDANVFMKVDGQKILLQDSKTNKGLDKFNRGKTDEFLVSLLPSQLNKITIGHDNALGAPGWYLKQVVIYRKDRPGKKATFKCDRWLSRTDEDKKIVRDLTAS